MWVCLSVCDERKLFICCRLILNKTVMHTDKMATAHSETVLDFYNLQKTSTGGHAHMRSTRCSETGTHRQLLSRSATRLRHSGYGVIHRILIDAADAVSLNNGLRERYRRPASSGASLSKKQRSYLHSQATRKPKWSRHAGLLRGSDCGDDGNIIL